MAAEINQQQLDSNQNPRITWEGCSVLLDINDGDRLVFSRLSAGSTLKIGDKKCSLRPLIGCPFGSLFQVETGSNGPFLSRVLAFSTEDDCLQEKSDSQIIDDSKDNRALVDDNTAQTLSGEDIEAMRRQGATGDQIVEALIANSSTFGTKTSFSQEKYRLKKQKKYAPRVLLRRPFARSISEAYFKKYPARIGFLRMDVLSLLLSMANVSAYSDVLVLDMVGGILTGAVAERLGGTGCVCNTYFGVTPNPMDIVRIFNFNNEICSRILRASVSDLCSAHKNNLEPPQEEKNAMITDFQSNADEAAMPAICVASSDFLSMSEDQTIQQEKSPPFRSNNVGATPMSENGNPSMPISMHGADASVTENEKSPPFRSNNVGATPMSENGNPSMPISMHGADASVNKASKSKQPGEKAKQEAINLWKEKGFSSLIIAAPEQDTWTIVQELLPFLSYSAPFAIYHQYLQPLAACMHNLQTEKLAIGLQISEPWLREYQVLPSRSHPFMQMSAFGGYILSGIKICNGEASTKSVPA